MYVYTCALNAVNTNRHTDTYVHVYMYMYIHRLGDDKGYLKPMSTL